MVGKILKTAGRHRQLITYGLIGATGALIDFVLYLFFYSLLGIPPVIASFLSVSAGIVNNFILNAFFNFKTKDNLFSRFLSFYSIGIGGAILSSVLILIIHNIIGIDATISKIATIAPVVLLQFFLNKKYSFSEARTKRISISRKNLITAGVILVSYALFIFQLTYLGFQDEYDNILGGWLMSHEGQVIYRDFFSHHMPLTYYVGALLTWLAGNDVNMVRFIFVNGLFIWLLFIYRRTAMAFGRNFGLAFLLLWTITHIPVLAHLLLAETLIAYACIHALMLIVFDLYKTKRPVGLADTIKISLLGMIPILTSINYATLSLLIYLSFAYCFLRQSGKINRTLIKKSLVMIVIIITPYLVLGGYMTATGSLRAGIRDAYTFNTHYYSQFTSSAGKTPIATYINRAHSVAKDATHALHISSHEKRVTLISTLSFIAICLGLVVLLLNREYFPAFWIGLAVYIASARGAITIDPYTEGTRRVAVYVFLVCFMLTYLIFSSGQRKITTRDVKERIVRLSSYFLAAVTFFFIFLQGAAYNLGVVRASLQIETGISMTPRGGKIADVINKVNDDNDTYWIGPWDFYTQLYIESKRASRYTFFLPWHGVCQYCTDEFVSDLETKTPRVIYWEHDLQMLGNNVDHFSEPVLSLLEREYTTLQDEALENFYFRNSDLQETVKRLKEMGYIL